MPQRMIHWLRSLLRDEAGNALIFAAALVVSFVAFAGSAVDGSRIYLVSSRLHQACDAGVLAGRRFMTDTAVDNTTLDASATTQANAFFHNNFEEGAYGSSNVTFTPTKIITTVNTSKTAQVTGTASANVPMTLMSIFGFSNWSVAVNCQATSYAGDVDVMFVLDTTGSMACPPPQPWDVNDTQCNPGTGRSYTRPSTDDSSNGNKSVPGYKGSTGYATTEQAGSRIAALRTAVVSFYDALAAASDPSSHIRYGFVTYSSGVNAGQAVLDAASAASSNNFIVGMSGNPNKTWTYQSRTLMTDRFGNSWWSYQPVTYDVSSLVAGNTITDPTKTGGQTTAWQGCLEERATIPGQLAFDITNLPNDLNPDLVPDATKPTEWKPLWPDIEYQTNGFSYGQGSNIANGWATCGKPVHRLATMSRTDVSNYVNATDFRALGGTYHDVGMEWGLRLISPTGLFAADTATWNGSASPPTRVIVFVTDGTMAPALSLYGEYGVESMDQRVAGGAAAQSSDLIPYHNARLQAICSAAKARNIKIWTVSIRPSVDTPLQTCATTAAQALSTTSGADLNAKFVAIANQVAQLQLTK